MGHTLLTAVACVMLIAAVHASGTLQYTVTMDITVSRFPTTSFRDTLGRFVGTGPTYCPLHWDTVPPAPTQPGTHRVSATFTLNTNAPSACGSTLESVSREVQSGSPPFSTFRTRLQSDHVGTLVDLTIGSAVPPGHDDSGDKEDKAWVYAIVGVVCAAVLGIGVAVLLLKSRARTAQDNDAAHQDHLQPLASGKAAEPAAEMDAPPPQKQQQRSVAANGSGDEPTSAQREVPPPRRSVDGNEPPAEQKKDEPASAAARPAAAEQQEPAPGPATREEEEAPKKPDDAAEPSSTAVEEPAAAVEATPADEPAPVAEPAADEEPPKAEEAPAAAVQPAADSPPEEKPVDEAPAADAEPSPDAA